MLRVGLEVGVWDVAAVAVPVLDVPPLARRHLGRVEIENNSILWLILHR